MSVELSSSRTFLRTVPLLAVLLGVGCAGFETGPAPLTADVPLHLEDHLDVATIVGSDIPADAAAPVEWRFDEPQPDWKPVPPRDPSAQRVKVSRTVDALRMIVREPHRGGPTTDFIRYARDGIYIDLPDWNREDWPTSTCEHVPQEASQYSGSVSTCLREI